MMVSDEVILPLESPELEPGKEAIRHFPALLLDLFCLHRLCDLLRR